MNEDTLDATARQCIARYSMLDAGDGIVVGVSGGPDSVALLLFLLDIAPDLDLRLHIAHVNHMIRGGRMLMQMRTTFKSSAAASECLLP